MSGAAVLGGACGAYLGTFSGGTLGSRPLVALLLGGLGYWLGLRASAGSAGAKRGVKLLASAAGVVLALSVLAAVALVGFLVWSFTRPGARW